MSDLLVEKVMTARKELHEFIKDYHKAKSVPGQTISNLQREMRSRWNEIFDRYGDHFTVCAFMMLYPEDQREEKFVALMEMLFPNQGNVRLH